MRAWSLFHKIPVAAGDAIITPISSTLPMEGARSTTQTPAFGYPSFLTLDHLHEYLYRFRVFSFASSYAASGTDPGTSFDWTVSGTMTGTLVSSLDSFDDEELLYTSWNNDPFYDRGAQGGFDGFGFAGTQSGSIDGVPFSNPTSSASNLQVAARQTQGLLTAKDPYYLRTDTGLYLPLIDLLSAETGATAFNPRFSTADTLNPGINEKEDIVAGAVTINGIASDASTILLDFLNWDSLSITITPIEWWEYADSLGNNPIWDAATGAALLPNTIRM